MFSVKNRFARILQKPAFDQIVGRQVRPANLDNRKRTGVQKLLQLCPAKGKDLQQILLRVDPQTILFFYRFIHNKSFLYQFLSLIGES